MGEYGIRGKGNEWKEEKGAQEQKRETLGKMEEYKRGKRRKAGKGRKKIEKRKGRRI